MDFILSIIETLRGWVFPPQYTHQELKAEFEAIIFEYESFQENIPEERGDLSWFEEDFRSIMVDVGKTGTPEEKQEFMNTFLNYRSGELIKYLPENPLLWLRSKGF